MRLSTEEQAILDGSRGPLMQKIMRTMVLYGEAMEAACLVDVEGDGHFVGSGAAPGIDMPIEMLEELANAGLRTRFPFTLNPRMPTDFENFNLTPAQTSEFREMCKDDPRFHESIRKIGLRDQDAYSCAAYVLEMGNAPDRGTVLAWSESSCVVYANSVLGARTNRNAALLDVLSNILGKTPLFGFLTDEGRKADWLVTITTSELPNPQLLGAEIGQRVQSGVPYVRGLDRFFSEGLDDRARDYLKEFGAACASIGAVGLYHVEGLTPEAQDTGIGLLREDHRTSDVTGDDLVRLLSSYPVMWQDKTAEPERAMIGCPHLSLRELHAWTDRICSALSLRERDTVAIETTLVAPPPVLKAFKDDTPDDYKRLRRTGARLSATCCEAFMNNSHCASEAVVTNSNKLRTFTTARLFLDAQLADVIATGSIPAADDPEDHIPTEKEPTETRRAEAPETHFQGRAVCPADISGEALVTQSGFNTLAAFFDAILDDADVARCSDHDASDLYGQVLTGKVLCIPETVGSTSAGATWELVARRRIAPAAVLFADKVDSLAAAGFALADVWGQQRICVVDRLGPEFLHAVQSGQTVTVDKDGSVSVGGQDA